MILNEETILDVIYFYFSKAFGVVCHSIMIAEVVRYGLAKQPISNKVNGKLSGLPVFKDCNCVGFGCDRVNFLHSS